MASVRQSTFEFFCITDCKYLSLTRLVQFLVVTPNQKIYSTDLLIPYEPVASVHRNSVGKPCVVRILVVLS